MRINFGAGWRVVVCKNKIQIAEQAGPANCETKHDLEFWTQEQILQEILTHQQHLAVASWN